MLVCSGIYMACVWGEGVGGAVRRPEKAMQIKAIKSAGMIALMKTLSVAFTSAGSNLPLVYMQGCIYVLCDVHKRQIGQDAML